MNGRQLILAFCTVLLFSTLSSASEVAVPYGTAKVDGRHAPVLNTVFDVSYDDPRKLAILYDFIRNTRKVTHGKVVVVSHGPELRAFAKENYRKYQAIVDQMATLATEGVEFKMCRNALRLAGFNPEDMHGFVTVVPSGFAEIAYYEYMGYQYINPTPLSSKDVRYAEHPRGASDIPSPSEMRPY